MRDALGAVGAAMTAAFVLTCSQGASAQAASPAVPESQTEDQAIVIGRREQHIQLVPLKDANLAAILSIGTPGLGQFYVGSWQKGLAFLGGVAGSLVAVGLAADNLSLSVGDYDDVGRGGNGDSVLNVAEYERWQNNPRRDFADLSTARKAVIIGGFGTALGLYVWNIVDAQSSAIEHNRRIYAQLTGIRVSLVVDPYGTARGQVSIPF